MNAEWALERITSSIRVKHPSRDLQEGVSPSKGLMNEKSEMIKIHIISIGEIKQEIQNEFNS